MPPVSLDQMHGYAQCPEPHQHEHQEFPVFSATSKHEAHHRDRKQDHRKKHVDDTDVTDRDTDQPQHNYGADGDGKIDSEQCADFL